MTTCANEVLPKKANCPEFFNANLIGAGLALFEPQQVAFRDGRTMLVEIFNHAIRSVSFAFATTLSGRGYARCIPHRQMNGYQIFRGV
jgi:predicted ABC-type ATPase